MWYFVKINAYVAKALEGHEYPFVLKFLDKK